MSNSKSVKQLGLTYLAYANDLCAINAPNFKISTVVYTYDRKR